MSRVIYGLMVVLGLGAWMFFGDILAPAEHVSALESAGLMFAYLGIALCVEGLDELRD